MALERRARPGTTARVLAPQAGPNAQVEFQTNGRRVRGMYVSVTPQVTSANPLVARVIAWIGNGEDGASHMPIVPDGTKIANTPGLLIADTFIQAVTRAATCKPEFIPLDVEPGTTEVITVEGSALDDGGGGVAAAWSITLISGDPDPARAV